MTRILKKYRDNKGFTLIEVALIILIGGILLASLSTGLLVYIKQAKINETREKMKQVTSAIAQFQAVNGYFPCPASRTIKADITGFGLEVGSGTPNDCRTGAFAGTALAVGGTGDNIRIGTVPVRSLNLPDDYMFDSWGNRLTYAVSAERTMSASYATHTGTIAVVDSTGGTVITPAGRGDYIVISHGQNGRGASNYEGSVAVACPVATALEAENCNDDATFRSTMVTSNNNASNAVFDDMISTGQQQDSTLPANAVVAFNLSSCPTGWTAYTPAVGRFVVGTTDGAAAATLTAMQETYTNGTTLQPAYILNSQGGKMQRDIQATQLPPHNHTVTYGALTVTLDAVGTTTTVLTTTAPTTQTGNAYGNGTSWDPLDNRPPYLALLYCQKN